MLGWGTDTTTDTDYWLIANSWNPYWGEKGYFRWATAYSCCTLWRVHTAAVS